MIRPCSDPRCPQVRIVNHTHLPQPTYRRASQCSESACVEVGFVPAKDCGTTTCVEVNLDHTEADSVYVRDSKSPGQPALRFTVDEWRTFVRGVKAGEFDA